MPNLELPFLWSAAVPSDGNVPIWSSARNQWEPGAQSGGSAAPFRVSGATTLLTSQTNVLVQASSAYTINLPAAPTDGLAFTFVDEFDEFNLNNITISGNGNNIRDVAQAPGTYAASTLLTVQGGSWTFTYSSSRTRWLWTA